MCSGLFGSWLLYIYDLQLLENWFDSDQTVASTLPERYVFKSHTTTVRA